MLSHLLEKRFETLLKLLLWIDQQPQKGTCTLTNIGTQLENRPKKAAIIDYIEEIQKDIKQLDWSEYIQLKIIDDCLEWLKGEKFHIYFFKMYYLRKSFGYCLLDSIIFKKYTNFSELVRQSQKSKKTCFKYLDNVKALLAEFQLKLDLRLAQKSDALIGTESQIRYFIYCFYYNTAFLEEFRISIIEECQKQVFWRDLLEICPDLTQFNFYGDQLTLYLSIVTFRINQGCFLQADILDSSMLDNPVITHDDFCSKLTRGAWSVDEKVRQREIETFYRVFSFIQRYDCDQIKRSNWICDYFESDEELIELIIIFKMNKHFNRLISYQEFSFLICNMYYINQISKHIVEVQKSVRELSMSSCTKRSQADLKLAQAVDTTLDEIFQQTKYEFLTDGRLRARYCELFKMSALEFNLKVNVYCISQETRLAQKALEYEVSKFLARKVQINETLSESTQLLISERPISDFLLRQNGDKAIYYLSKERTKADWEALELFIDNL